MPTKTKRDEEKWKKASSARVASRHIRSSEADDAAESIFLSGTPPDDDPWNGGPPKISVSFTGIEALKTKTKLPGLGRATHVDTALTADTTKNADGVYANSYLFVRFLKAYPGQEKALLKAFQRHIEPSKIKREIAQHYEDPRFGWNLLNDVFDYRESDDWENPTNVKVQRVALKMYRNQWRKMSPREQMRMMESLGKRMHYATRHQAIRRGMPSEVGSSSLLKKQGLTPVDVFFGETREHKRPLIKSGEGVQDRRGKVYFFVGLDVAGKAILADTEREWKTMHKQLVDDRKHVIVAGASRVAARYLKALQVPDDIENDILDAAFTSGIKFKSPITVEIEAAKGEIMIGLEGKRLFENLRKELEGQRDADKRAQKAVDREIDKIGRKMERYLKKEGYDVSYDDGHLNIDTD